MEMSPEQLDAIADRIYARIREDAYPFYVAPKEHKEDHDMIREYFRLRAERAAQWSRIKESVLGWIIITALGGTLIAIGRAVYAFVEHWVVTRGGS